MEGAVITKIRYSPRGDIVYMDLKLPNISEEQSVCCATEFLEERGWSLQGGDTLNADRLTALLKLDACTRAVQKGLTLLDYSDQTARSLQRKLSTRGFDRESADFAVSYLCRKRWIREDEYMRRLIRKYYQKGYGPSRIKNELYAKGFDRELFSTVFEEETAELDFDLSAEAVLKKLGSAEMLSDMQGRKKIFAAMQRRGFSFSQIRSAAEQMQNAADDDEA